MFSAIKSLVSAVKASSASASATTTTTVGQQEKQEGTKEKAEGEEDPTEQDEEEQEEDLEPKDSTDIAAKFEKIATLRDSKAVCRFVQWSKNSKLLFVGTWLSFSVSAPQKGKFANIYVYDVLNNFKLLQVIQKHENNCRSICLYGDEEEKMVTSGNDKKIRFFKKVIKNHNFVPSGLISSHEQDLGESALFATEEQKKDESNFWWIEDKLERKKEEEEEEEEEEKEQEEEKEKKEKEPEEEKIFADLLKELEEKKKKEKKQKATAELEFPENVASVLVDAGKNHLINCTNEGLVYLHELDTRKFVNKTFAVRQATVDTHTKNPFASDAVWINMIAFDPLSSKRRFASVSVDCSLCLFDSKTLEKLAVLPETPHTSVSRLGGFWCLAFSPRGNEIAIGTACGRVLIVSLYIPESSSSSSSSCSLQELREKDAVLTLKYSCQTHSRGLSKYGVTNETVNWVTYSLDSQILFSASRDSSVLFTHAISGRRVGKKPLVAGTDWLTSCSPSNDHRFFAVSSGSGQTQIFKNYFSDLKFAVRIKVARIQRFSHENSKISAALECWNVYVGITRFMPYLDDFLCGPKGTNKTEHEKLHQLVLPAFTSAKDVYAPDDDDDDDDDYDDDDGGEDDWFTDDDDDESS